MRTPRGRSERKPRTATVPGDPRARCPFGAVAVKPPGAALVVLGRLFSGANWMARR